MTHFAGEISYLGSCLFDENCQSGVLWDATQPLGVAHFKALPYLCSCFQFLSDRLGYYFRVLIRLSEECFRGGLCGPSI